MIAVTGATGTIGSELVRLLVEAGREVRALTRRPGDQDPRPGVEWVGADLSDRSGLAGVLEGCDRLFLLTGNNEGMVRQQTNAIRAAGRAGVKRVVKLSALGATDHSKSVIGLWHHNVEGKLRDSGLDWTLLRPHHFMQNLLDPLVFDREAGVVYSAAGDGSIPLIDTRDIAAVAAVTLTEDGHEGEVYTLTGPEAVSFPEAVGILSDVLGRGLEYRPQTMDQAWRRRRDAGQPVWLAAAQLAIAGYQREEGATARTSDAVESVTGRPPRSFRQFAEDHIKALRGKS